MKTRSKKAPKKELTSRNLVDVKVNLNQDATPHIVGRNGTVSIASINIWGSGATAFIDGVSEKTGLVINGGLKISSVDMDKVAVGWLLKRGYVIRKEPTALIPMSYEDMEKEHQNG